MAGHWSGLIIMLIHAMSDSTASYGHLKQFIEESVLMCSFDHPHVLGMVGICLDHNNSPYLLLPFMENGDLKNFLKKKRETLHPSRETYPEVSQGKTSTGDQGFNDPLISDKIPSERRTASLERTVYNFPSNSSNYTQKEDSGHKVVPMCPLSLILGMHSPLTHMHTHRVYVSVC